MHTKVLLALVMTWICSFGCTKQEQPDNCEEIQQVTIKGAKESYYVGDTIYLKASLIPTISLFSWNGGQQSNEISSETEILIYPCRKNDEGWYYLHVSYPDCSTKHDSVYISVKNYPETAPCSPANNTVSFSSMPQIVANTVTWSLYNSYNARELKAHQSAGYRDFNIYFHPYWNSREPENGAYNVGSLPSLNDSDVYTMYMNTQYSGLLFQPVPGTAYVTHVNGKLVVTFCDINFSASNGSSSFKATASGCITAP